MLLCEGVSALVAAQSPNPALAPWLDLRACKIADPVDRLRFLRREMGLLASEDKPKPSRRVPCSFLFWVALALLTLMSSRRTAAVPSVMADAPTRPAAVAPKTAPKVWLVRGICGWKVGQVWS
jgi:hypothetical protein